MRRIRLLSGVSRKCRTIVVFHFLLFEWCAYNRNLVFRNVRRMKVLQENSKEIKKRRRPRRHRTTADATLEWVIYYLFIYYLHVIIYIFITYRINPSLSVYLYRLFDLYKIYLQDLHLSWFIYIYNLILLKKKIFIINFFYEGLYLRETFFRNYVYLKKTNIIFK